MSASILRLPGMIDVHVHLRDPGATHKEDFYTGTFAAISGGIVAVFDMPNNIPPIFSQNALGEKEKIAKKKAVCDWGLYFGSNGENTEEFDKIANSVVGLKLYLGDKKNMPSQYAHVYIGDDLVVREVFQAWPKDKIIVLHAEGKYIDLAINLSRTYGNRIHITHVSSRETLEKIIDAKKSKVKMTCDVTPHHLFLTRDDAKRLKGFGAVAPPLEDKEDVQYLWNNLNHIDCIATDHAPHTREEKEQNNPPFGLPGLETALPLLLTAFHNGRLSLEDIVRLTSTSPAKIFGIPLDKKTWVEVDTNQTYVIENRNLKTTCGWSPYNGWKVRGKIKRVFIRGTKVFEEGNLLVAPGFGINLFPEE